MMVSRGSGDNSLASAGNTVWHNVGHFKHLRSLSFALNLFLPFIAQLLIKAIFRKAVSLFYQSSSWQSAGA